MDNLSFPILGRAFHAENVPPLLERWLKEHLYYPEVSPPENFYSIKLEVLDKAPDLGEGVSRKSEADMNDEVFWWKQDGSRWWFVEGDTGIQFIVDSDAFNITIWGIRNGSRPELKKTFMAMYLAFLEAIRVSGLFPLHASVAIKDDLVTAYTGESGMGKSTTLVKALADGAEPLAEDLSWLDPRTTTIYGWDNGLRFWEDGWEKLPEKYKKMDWNGDRDGKMILPWDKLDLERTPSAQLDQLYLLRRCADEKELLETESVPTHLAVRALWEASGVPLTDTAKKKISQGIAQLLSRLQIAVLYI